MILVDSCVWIDLFKGQKNPQTEMLESLSCNLSEEICISHIIEFEVLRGIRSDLERKRIEKLFHQLVHYDFTYQDFDQLTFNYLKCVQKGINNTKLGDWLILKTVQDHALVLLTSDKDFFHIRKHCEFGLVGF